MTNYTAKAEALDMRISDITTHINYLGELTYRWVLDKDQRIAAIAAVLAEVAAEAEQRGREQALEALAGLRILPAR